MSALQVLTVVAALPKTGPGAPLQPAPAPAPAPEPGLYLDIVLRGLRAPA
ncbi:hypothetical protein [Streptomyces sp. NBC_01497]|nr:hypothetical protein [Streptomyces sp. NBC_01497]